MSRNQEYWKKRMEDLEASRHREAEKVVQDLETMYRGAERQIEADLSRWWQRFADNNGHVSMAEARRLMTSEELKELKWTLKEYEQAAKANGNGEWEKELENASARWHISRLEGLKYQLQNSVEVLAGGQADALDALLKQTYSNQYGQTAFTIQSGLGIGWDISGLSNNQIQTVLQKPWALDGRNFSSRIWENKQALIGELHKQLTQHMMTGNDLNKVIDSIEKKFGVSRSNAARLVYTENAYAMSVASGDSYRALGVERVYFIAVLDERTSEICQQMDGTVIEMKDYQPGVTVPPLHPWCRSTTAPYYKELDGIGERAARDPETGKTYYVPRNMTYKEWEKTFMNDDPEEGSKLKDKLKEVVTRSYESPLAKAFGKEYYDAHMDILTGCENADAQAMWEAYEDDIEVTTTAKRGTQCCNWTASLEINLKDNMAGNWYDKPGQTTFHEAGHAIDMIAGRRYGFDKGTVKMYYPDGIYSVNFRNGEFPKTIKEEVAAMVTAKDAAMKAEFKAHKTDIDWLRNHGYIGEWKYNYFKEHGTWIGGEPSYTKSMAYNAIATELKKLNPYQRADLEDILEGATRGKLGEGHGNSYWKHGEWTLSTEAFAEMYDSTVANHESLEAIKKYLPKSYGVFEDMMKELAEGVK